MGATCVTGVATNSHNTLKQFKGERQLCLRREVRRWIDLYRCHQPVSADATMYSSANASPNTRIWMPEIFWMPIQNVRVGAQYFAYTQFDGASKNYDGAGRSTQKTTTTFFFYVWGAY